MKKRFKVEVDTIKHKSGSKSAFEDTSAYLKDDQFNFHAQRLHVIRFHISFSVWPTAISTESYKC